MTSSAPIDPQTFDSALWGTQASDGKGLAYWDADKKVYIWYELPMWAEKVADDDPDKPKSRILAYISTKFTEADYLIESSYYHFILESELVHPSLIFCKDKLDAKGKEETTFESYILEVFDPTLPHYRMKKRLGNYVKYLDEEDLTWKEETSTEKLPILLFACSRTTDLIYARCRTRNGRVFGLRRPKSSNNKAYSARFGRRRNPSLTYFVLPFLLVKSGSPCFSRKNRLAIYYYTRDLSANC